MPEPIQRQKRYDVFQDMTWYQLEPVDVEMLNTYRGQLDLRPLEFVTPGEPGPAAEAYVLHTGEEDCPVCQARGPHVVEGTD